MAVLYPNVSEKDMLDLIRVNRLEGASLSLFQNDYTPLNTDTVSEYTEADFGGYAAVSLTSWTSAFTNAEGKAQTNSISALFEHDGTGISNTVYGWYVHSSGLLIMAERFANPVTFAAADDTYVVSIAATLVGAFQNP